MLLGCFVNTPARVDRYAVHLPWFPYLRTHESTMSEYGYLHRISPKCAFYSRLSVDELQKVDEETGEEASAILWRTNVPKSGKLFLRMYTPVNNPYLHEAKVHFARRERYRQTAWKYRKDDPVEFARHFTIAYRENEILEKYFPKIVSHPGLRLSEFRRAEIERHYDPKSVYLSPVSRNVIVRFSEKQVVGILGFLLLVLAIWYRRLGRSSRGSVNKCGEQLV